MTKANIANTIVIVAKHEFVERINTFLKGFFEHDPTKNTMN